MFLARDNRHAAAAAHTARQPRHAVLHGAGGQGQRFSAAADQRHRQAQARRLGRQGQHQVRAGRQLHRAAGQPRQPHDGVSVGADQVLGRIGPAEGRILGQPLRRTAS